MMSLGAGALKVSGGPNAIHTCIILHTFEPHGHLLECTEQVNQG